MKTGTQNVSATCFRHPVHPPQCCYGGRAGRAALPSRSADGNTNYSFFQKSTHPVSRRTLSHQVQSEIFLPPATKWPTPLPLRVPLYSNLFGGVPTVPHSPFRVPSTFSVRRWMFDVPGARGRRSSPPLHSSNSLLNKSNASRH